MPKTELYYRASVLRMKVRSSMGPRGMDKMVVGPDGAGTPDVPLLDDREA